MKTKSKDKMYGYRIIKSILGGIYNFYYTPKVIGSENIPKDGSVLIVGNHIHIMDQNSICLATKRPVHYMAKKEYFDSAKTRWFFKIAGCIPVDRKIHDDSAKSAALEVLNEGHALGLFPEGTRNGLKDEKIRELYEKYINSDEIDYDTFYKKVKKNRTSQVNYLESLLDKKVITKDNFISNIYNIDEYLKILISEKKIKEKDYYNNILLPFKFGAVSMAQPFKVGKEEDLESANKKLSEEIRNLIYENLKNNGK